MNTSLFMCPICQKPLMRENQTYRCDSGHSFDVAKEGYVNLLPANQRHSSAPGDDREMVNARTRFLDGGWYAPLRDCLCEIVGTCPAEKPVLIDAGCGEGYYTAALSGVITGKNGRTAGVDLSKAAVRRAARRCPRAEIAVASVYRLPFGERSADVLLDCFSPLAIDEFRRVLKPGGQFLYVIPGPAHLWELKEILYDSPYENAVREEEYDGFTQTDSVPLQFPLSLQSGDEIEALFRMTPYTWKTPRDGVDRLASVRELKVTAQFRILAFQRKD